VIVVAAFWPTDLFAQRRPVRRSSPRTVVVAGPRYYGSPFFYSRFYYPGYYGSFYDPYYFGFYGQYPYPYPYYGRFAYDDTGAARLEVKPRNAQVYVDGYFVGLVDDFDGTFQRLNIDAGEHDLQVYLPGYQTFAQKVLFVRGRTLKLAADLQPLAPGESAGPPPKPDPSTAPRSTQPYRGGDQGDQPGPRGPQRSVPQVRGPDRDQSGFGSLLLRVRPGDAEVIVDGETWNAPQGDDPFVIELADGSHRVEVRKNGFTTYSTTVQVRRGQTVRLNVSLTAARSGEV
jgi:hypothetical protein